MLMDVYCMQYVTGVLGKCQLEGEFTGLVWHADVRRGAAAACRVGGKLDDLLLQAAGRGQAPGHGEQRGVAGHGARLRAGAVASRAAPWRATATG